MFFIALQMLIGDKVKYITMTAAVCFSTIIMTQQPGILVGLLSRTYSFISDTPGADIWVMDPGVSFVEDGKQNRAMNLNLVKGIEGIQWAVPMFKGMVLAKLPSGAMASVDMTGVDDATLVGAPLGIGENLSKIKMADAILVEEGATKGQLKIKSPDGSSRPLAVGDVLEINDRRAAVVGIYKGTRNFILQPQITTLYSRAVGYTTEGRKKLSYILVKVKAGYDADKIIQEINQKTGLKALKEEDFKKQNLNYWKDNTGIPINFGISVFLGFLVGAAVVGQTFFNFIHENAKYYAALQAMGISIRRLIQMVAFQSLFIGVNGFGMGLFTTVIFGILSHDSILAFRFSPYVLLFAAFGIFFIILISAILSIRKLTKIDPSMVFRS
ncbi:MAG: hypothetical protein CNLJKLNK_00542 [Holosporales bacterium]